MTALVVIGAIVLGFGSAELAVRWKQFSQFGDEGAVEKSKKYFVDEDTKLRLPVPNTKHGKIEINSLGFRGDEIAIPKPAGTIRFVFLGSSTTFDPYVSNLRATWSAVAIDALRHKFPSCVFDFANAGVPGMSTKHLGIYFLRLFKTVAPDIAVVLTNDMNIRLDAVAREKGVEGADNFKPSWLGKHSMFWAKVEKNARTISLQRAADRTVGKLVVSPNEITVGFEKELYQLVQSISAKRALPVLLTNVYQFSDEQAADERRAAISSALFFMPYMTTDGLMEMTSAFNRSIRVVAEKTGVPAVDATDEISGKTDYFSDAMHFSAKGSKQAGELVGKAFAKDPQILNVVRAAGAGCAGVGS